RKTLQTAHDRPIPHPAVSCAQGRQHAMTNQHRARRAPRTVLEQKIWESNQTFEEYAEYAEQVARDHHEPATLGVRHLERLAAGRRGDGRPLGPVRPATARPLERLI